MTTAKLFLICYLLRFDSTVRVMYILIILQFIAVVFHDIIAFVMVAAGVAARKYSTSIQEAQ